jgi:superfamily II DNA or RNA helicase
MIKVQRSNIAVLTDYTPEEKERIIADLTYNNPAYENARRHSTAKYIYRISPYLTYYTDNYGSLTVPRGYNIPFKHKIITDNRHQNHTVEYPKFHTKLRKTQEEAFEAYVDSFQKSVSGNREKGVISIPTGKGKCVLGLKIASHFKQKALIVVQKEDLIQAWKTDAFMTMGLKPIQIGLIKAKQFRIGEQITLTTIQTLHKLGESTIRKLHKIFGMIIVDEFHHSVARTYELVNYFPAIHRIGLTATPFRNDGLDGVLYHYFGGIAYEYADVGQNDEDIMPVSVRIRYIATRWNPEREYVFTNLKGIWTENSLLDFIRKNIPKYKHLNFETILKQKIFGENKMIPLRISDIRKAVSGNGNFHAQLSRDIIQEYLQNKSCIVFFHEKNHCYTLYRLLVDAGVPQEYIQLYVGAQGKDKPEGVKLTSKPEMIRRAESKEVLITIATYAIATEGTNVKAWERGFLGSTVANDLDLVQCIGRLRRRKPGKRDVIIYDYRFPNISGASKHGKVRDKLYRERNFRYSVIR